MITQCPRCHEAADVPATAIGKRARCGRCQSVFTIARPASTPPPPSHFTTQHTFPATPASDRPHPSTDATRASRRRILIVGGCAILLLAAAIIALIASRRRGPEVLAWYTGDRLPAMALSDRAAWTGKQLLVVDLRDWFTPSVGPPSPTQFRLLTPDGKTIQASFVGDLPPRPHPPDTDGPRADGAHPTVAFLVERASADERYDFVDGASRPIRLPRAAWRDLAAHPRAGAWQLVDAEQVRRALRELRQLDADLAAAVAGEDYEAAAAHCRKFLADHPSLAPAARADVERRLAEFPAKSEDRDFRRASASAAADPAAAAAAWATYLQRHPQAPRAADAKAALEQLSPWRVTLVRASLASDHRDGDVILRPAAGELLAAVDLRLSITSADDADPAGRLQASRDVLSAAALEYLAGGDPPGVRTIDPRIKQATERLLAQPARLFVSADAALALPGRARARPLVTSMPPGDGVSYALGERRISFGRSDTVIRYIREDGCTAILLQPVGEIPLTLFFSVPPATTGARLELPNAAAIELTFSSPAAATLATADPDLDLEKRLAQRIKSLKKRPYPFYADRPGGTMDVRNGTDVGWGEGVCAWHPTIGWCWSSTFAKLEENAVFYNVGGIPVQVAGVPVARGEHVLWKGGKLTKVRYTDLERN